MKMMDIIRSRMVETLPFAKLLGIEITELKEGEGAALLPERADLFNHIGSVHAGAIFAVGEAASGAAMAGTFADVINVIRPLAAGLSIKYLKVAKGPLTARARTIDPVETLRSKLDVDGRVAFDIVITVQNAENATVAELSAAWNVRKA